MSHTDAAQKSSENIRSDALAVTGLRLLGVYGILLLLFASGPILLQSFAPSRTVVRGLTLLAHLKFGLPFVLLFCMHYLWRGGASRLDRVAGYGLYLLQFVLLVVLFLSLLVPWLPGASKAKLPSFIARGDAIYFLGALLVLTLTSLRTSLWLRSPSRQGNRLAQILWWIVTGLSAIILSLSLLWRGFVSIDKAAGRVTPAPVSYALILLAVALVLASFQGAACLLRKDNPNAQKTDWVRHQFFLRMLTALFLLQLTLLLFQGTISGLMAYKKALKVASLFLRMFPINMLALNILLIAVLFRLSQNKEASRASLWYKLSAAALATTAGFQCASLSSIFSANWLHSAVRTGSSYTTTAFLTGWLTLLLSLTALRETALHLGAEKQAQRIGNLRWIIVGMTTFSGTVLGLLFVTLAKAGFLFILFVGVCIFIISVILLVVVFINIYGVVDLIEKKRLSQSTN